MVFLLCLQFVCKQSANSSQFDRTEWNKNGKILVFHMKQQSIYDNYCILDCCFFCENRVCSIVVWLVKMYFAENDCCFNG